MKETDLFENKKISPMLLRREDKPFDSDDYIFELKFDGIRCLAYLDDKTILINRRNKDITNVFPELKDINKQVKGKCILDGEIIYIDENGKPNFNLLQQRSLLNNSFKISLKAKRNPVTFIAFDILYSNGHITYFDLLKRKEILTNIVVENQFINITQFIEKNGIELFQKVKEEGLEGIIAKLKNSTYQIGKRSNDWIKIKNLIDEDFIICGYTLKENRIQDLVLGHYDYGNLCFAGYIYLERKRQEENYILKYAKNNTLKAPLFKELANEDIVWIKPNLVCTVSYMLRTESGAMRQPFFKAIREDKNPREIIKSY